MKRKNGSFSPTEECFDSFMMAAQSRGEEAEEEGESGDSPDSRGAPEWERDSDYGGSDSDPGEATTLRMLLENIQVSGEGEVLCGLQEAGVAGRWRRCEGCGGDMRAVPGPPPRWACSACPRAAPLHLPWLSPPPPHLSLRARDVAVLSYCWARDYPLALASHEAELPDASAASFLYDRASLVAARYFNDEMSNVGGPQRVVEVEKLETEEGAVVGGAEAGNPGTAFLVRLPPSWSRDDLVSALADNAAHGSTLRLSPSPDSSLLKAVGEDGVEYLESVWGLKAEEGVGGGKTRELWEEFSASRLAPERLHEFLFRKRMDSSRDPFLFFLAVVASLYPPPTRPPSSSSSS